MIRSGFEPRMKDVVTGALVRLLPAAVVLAACGEAPVAADLGAPYPPFDEAPSGECRISTNEIFNGGPGKDGISALTDPAMVFAGEPEAQYLSDQARVIGVEIGDDAIAIPHNILWWHEIVNLNVGGRQLAVTYCPLTGSSIVFDRENVGGAEFGVSGLIYRNNLIMYDRRDEESLWPQMLGQAACGPAEGTPLSHYPAVEMTWEGWRTLHTETRVVAVTDDNFRDYSHYPYGDYEALNNRSTLFPNPPIDPRRPPKERVLGVGALTFPFGLLASLGSLAVADAGVYNRRPVVVFWDDARQAAAAFYATVGNEVLQFTVEDSQICDIGTHSVWRIHGRAVEGPRAGQRLEPVAEAYVAFWFAWTSFQPTILWTPG